MIDEEITFNIVNIWLRTTGSLDYASDEETAVAKLKNDRYDVVIMDINLKKRGNGIEVLKKLRKISGYEDIPVIACTAYAMKGDKENLLLEGFNYYLAKPFQKDELLLLINALSNLRNN